MIHTDTLPGHEGSAEAVSILLLLHRNGAMEARELAERAGIDRSDMQPALLGLRERHRIHHISGHGMAAIWKLKGPTT